MHRALIISLLCLLPWAASAQRGSQLSTLEKRISLLQTHQVRLEKLHTGQVERIGRLKSRSSGVRRDYQLSRALSDNRVLSAKLTRLQDQIRGLNQKLLAVYDRAIASSRDKAEATRLRQRRAKLVSQLDGSNARIVTDEKASPLDSPEDLEEKADLLKDSEEKVRRKIQRIQRQMTQIKRRMRVRRYSRALNASPFVESSPRRVARARSSSSTMTKPSPDSPSRITGSGDNSYQEGTQKAGSGEEAPPPAPPSSDFNGAGPGAMDPSADSSANDTDDVLPGMTPVFPSGGGGTVTTSSSDLSVTMRSVLDPSIIKELEKADKSGDLKARLKALARAKKQLKQVADKLGARAKSLSQRATSRKSTK